MNVSDAEINSLLESDGECSFEDIQVANLMKILNNTKIPKSNKKKVECRSKKHFCGNSSSKR